MTIALLCPNNHKLFCPESMAGKRGKCPHCGATFRVPDMAAGSSSPNVTSARPVAVGQGGSSPSKLGQAVVEEPAEEHVDESPQLETAAETSNPIHPYVEGQETGPDDLLFFCPHEHQLYGPATLGGTPGQCPVCGAEFMVPTADDLEPVEGGDAANLDNLLSSFDGQTAQAEEHEEYGHAAPSLSELFEGFWAYRAQGATVELHLGDGKVFIPDGYAPQLSQRGQGVFMRREANGSYTLTCIAWDSISHVAVKGVRNLPEGLFDLPG